MNEDALRLIDACCEAFDLYQESKDGQTFCNFSVQHISGRMGYDKFKGMVADQMVDFLRRSSDWTIVDMDAAQGLANDGRLVVAGVQKEPHGHVVVVRPGIEEFSPKWSRKATKVCSVGGTGKSYIGRSLAWAFEEIPEIWVMKQPQGETNG